MIAALKSCIIHELYNAQGVIASQKIKSAPNRRLTVKFVLIREIYKLVFERRHAYDYQEGFKKE